MTSAHLVDSGVPAQPPHRRRRRALAVVGLVLAYLLLLVLGVAVGVVGAFYSGWKLGHGTLALPAGLLLGIVGCLALFLGGRQLVLSRLGAAVPGVAWLLAVIVLSAARPEGDVVLPANAITGYAYLFGGAIAAAFASSLPTLPDKRRILNARS